MSGVLPWLENAITTSSTLLFHPFKLFTLLLTIFFTYRWVRSSYASRNSLPPSPPKLPIIGNFHRLGKHPHRSLQSLSRQYGDLMLIQLGSIPCLIVSSADSACEIMKTNDVVFAERPQRDITRRLLYNGRDIAFAPYSEYWRQLKSLSVIHLLSNMRVRSYSWVRVEETALMIDKIRKSLLKEVNLTNMLMTLTNDVVCRVAFGKKYSGQGGASSFSRVMEEFNGLLAGFYLGNFIPWMAWIHRLDGVDAKVERVVKELDQLFEGIVQAHLDSPHGIDQNGGEVNTIDKSKDFVDILLELQREEPGGLTMDRESIKAIILDAFVAGTDTTYAVLEWGMSELLKHPEAMKALQSEVRGIMGDRVDIKEEDMEKMLYLKAVIKETLRLHPPIPLLVPRVSNQHIKLKGYDIPKGTQVITNAWAIQQDPTYWNEPEKFHPERFLGSNVDFRGQDFQLIPFGAGRRGCPGISFATATSELVLANLVHKFDWLLPGGAKYDLLDMSEISGLTIHRKTPLLAVPCLPS